MMEHALAKTILSAGVIEMIAKKHGLTLKEARDSFYGSEVVDMLEDDETGLYGESALFLFSLYEDRLKKAGNSDTL